MKQIKLFAFYSHNGDFKQGKEYTVYLRPDKVKIAVNEKSRILEGSEAREFIRLVENIHLENAESNAARPGFPVLMKWEMACIGDTTFHTAQGENTFPPSVAQLIKTIGVFTDDFSPQSDLLHTAIRFATDAHKGQYRKGSDVPYIVHPLEVLHLLRDMNADENLQIAGVLHDVVEDTPVTIEQVEEIFGKEIARLVASHTEEEGKSWREQKRATIEIVRNADKPVQMLIMADKISNLKSMLYDYLEKGEELWKRFGSTKEMQSWHNNRLIAALLPLATDPDTAKHYEMMKKLFFRLYVDYYADYDNGLIYEYVTGLETHLYSRHTAQWTNTESVPQGHEKISCDKAIRLINLWAGL